MSLIITRPLLRNGYTDIGQTALYTMSTIIDFGILSQNMQTLFQALNGGLHACNIKTPSPGRVWGDTVIQFPVRATDTARQPGVDHSHNGIDSAALGAKAVNMKTTNYKSYGAWMCPAGKATLLLLHGSAEITTGKDSAASTYLELLLDVPLDYEQFPYNVTTSLAKGFFTVRCEDPNYQGKITSVIGTVVTKGQNIPYLHCVIKFSELVHRKEAFSGLWVDYVFTMLVFINS